LVPFDVELEADYSPENIFFRQFHFWNQHADLSAFVGVAKNYFQVQDLRFELNGHSRLSGNVFLPISAAKIRENSSWLASLSADPFFDVDLTLDALDIAEFAGAVKTKPDLSGPLPRAIAQFHLTRHFHARDSERKFARLGFAAASARLRQCESRGRPASARLRDLSWNELQRPECDHRFRSLERPRRRRL